MFFMGLYFFIVHYPCFLDAKSSIVFPSMLNMLFIGRFCFLLFLFASIGFFLFFFFCLFCSIFSWWEVFIKCFFSGVQYVAKYHLNIYINCYMKNKKAWKDTEWSSSKRINKNNICGGRILCNINKTAFELWRKTSQYLKKGREIQCLKREQMTSCNLCGGKVG